MNRAGRINSTQVRGFAFLVEESTTCHLIPFAAQNSSFFSLVLSFSIGGGGILRVFTTIHLTVYIYIFITKFHTFSLYM